MVCTVRKVIFSVSPQIKPGQRHSFIFTGHSTSVPVLITHCLSIFNYSHCVCAVCVTHSVCHLHLFENAALSRLVFCFTVSCCWWVQGRGEGCGLIASKQQKYISLCSVFCDHGPAVTVCCVCKKWTLKLQWNWTTEWMIYLWRKTGRIAGGTRGGGEWAWSAGRVRTAAGPRLSPFPSRAPCHDLCLQKPPCPAPFPCRGVACHLLWGICSCTGWHADAGYPGLWSLLLFWWQ